MAAAGFEHGSGMRCAVHMRVQRNSLLGHPYDLDCNIFALTLATMWCQSQAEHVHSPTDACMR
jgi:hypothetical protein